jgi:predicted nucleotidyltransferase component of viral defense system
MIAKKYKDRAVLLVKVMRQVAKEKDFVLLGGTAINFFIMDMPRISVDLDLMYLPISPRKEALENIEAILMRVKDNIKAAVPGIKVRPAGGIEGRNLKLELQDWDIQLKIEVNATKRGVALPVQTLGTKPAVEKILGNRGRIQVISTAELYGGKICAALSRQHPRDIFDIRELMENEGLTEEIKQGAMIMMMGDGNPISELLSPVLKDQRSALRQQFVGMAEKGFSYKEYEQTRAGFIRQFNAMFTENDKKFLLSFEMGNPDWGLFPHKVDHLPAIQWKLKNIDKLKKNNPEKHQDLVDDLKIVLGFKKQYDFLTGKVADGGIKYQTVALAGGGREKLAAGTLCVDRGKGGPKEYFLFLARGQVGKSAISEISAGDKLKVMGKVREQTVTKDNKRHVVKKITVKGFRVLEKQVNKDMGMGC